MVDEDLKQPTARNWLSFWSLVTMQALQSFNVNAAKFILMALAVWMTSLNPDYKGREHIVTLCLVVPYVLLAPTCGWLSDRYAKSAVVQWMSWLQIVVLALTALAIHFGSLEWGIAGFFLISAQAALISPAKLGVVKEYVGGQRLGFASGVMEGTVILAILAGQIIGGTWFDTRLGPETGGFHAAIVPLYWLLLFALLSVGMAHLVEPSAKHPSVPLSWKLATSHAGDLRELFTSRRLRLCGMGVGFFWGFGGFIALAVLQIAEELNKGGGKGTGTSFAHLWTMAVVGIAVGSVIAGLISRKHIEMGLSPIGGVVMTGSTLALTFTPGGSVIQQVMLMLAGAGGAAFLVPLQATLQDAPAEDKRGTVISASNLLNNLFGIVATILQFALKAGKVPVPLQFGILGLLALAVTVISFRNLGSEVIRLIGLAVVRTIYRIRVTGADRIPKTGGVLLLPNHVTWADAFFLSAASPRPVRFVMDETFMSNPWVARFSTIFKTVPIDRGSPREALRITADALKEGQVLCLFPEGQLSRTGTLCELQRGFELIGRMAKCPLVPVWVDGSWGSIFSFEGGRFFRKKPYKLPYELSVAFSAPLDPKDANTAIVRDKMLEASAEAIAERFADDENPAHLIRGFHWANGYQIGQIQGLPRQSAFATLGSDPLPDALIGVTTVFPEQFNSKCLTKPAFDPSIQHWLGGATLREAIVKAPQAPVVFFDFSPEALVPIERADVIHCPCLAIDGLVVAMSMPDPPLPTPTSEPQIGKKAGTWGKLLPGFFPREGTDGRLRLFGPAAPEEGLLLPEGAKLDDEGFVAA